MNDPGSEIPIVFNNCISVKGAAFHSGYNEQYLRRLLRDKKIKGDKIGQIWLIRKASLEAYLRKTQWANDRRFGPKEQ